MFGRGTNLPRCTEFQSWKVKPFRNIRMLDRKYIYPRILAGSTEEPKKQAAWPLASEKMNENRCPVARLDLCSNPSKKRAQRLRVPLIHA